MTDEKIKFGTSGWRGIIGEDFTFDRVRLAVQGICNYLRKSGIENGSSILIGFDTRFLSEKFASEASQIVAYNNYRALLCRRDLPTPTISFETIRRGAVGAINFTASHNPPEYNGLKYSTADGAPALPEVTSAIEAEIHALQEKAERIDVYRKDELIDIIDPRERYLEHLGYCIDLPAISESGLKIGIDPLYGTAREYLDYFLLAGNVTVRIIHNYRDPYFGGYSPESNQKNLSDLRRLVKAQKLDFGLATDGDADRFGVVDHRGRFVSPNIVIALLALYLKRVRKFEGDLARSVATTHLIDRIAEGTGCESIVTPVGFKYIGELILDDRIALGGEESAGLSIRGHLPEKDGILACLLVAEMLAVTKKTLPELTRELYDEFGPHFSKRIDMRVTPALISSLKDKLANPPQTLEGRVVVRAETTDGVKLVFDEQTWILLRFSGTEPVVRLYAEACSPKDLKKLLDTGKRFIKNAL